jgi:hypothetical protein
VWRAYACLSVVAGCIEPNVLRCGDLTCPPSESCVDGVVCATQGQIDACAGLPDAAACRSAPVGDGYCSHGACVADVCGDGQLEGNEVCDGDLVTKSCKDLNYYYGSTACTAGCELDFSGCSGRCGDAIVQSDQGEDCDGAPPAFDCTDVGYDFGALTCRNCTADPIHSCKQFGWSKVGVAINFSAKLVGDAGMYAILWTGSVEVHDAAGVSTHGSSFVAAEARAGDVVAATSNAVELYHAGSWTALAAPSLPNGAAITEVVFATDGTPFVLAPSSTGCAIGSYTAGAWTFSAGPVGCKGLIAIAPGNYALVAADGAVHWTWPGCSAMSGNPCECGRAYSVVGTPQAIVPSGVNLAVYSFDVSADNVLQTIVPQCGGGPSATPLGTVPTATTIPKLVLRGSEVYAFVSNTFSSTVWRVAYERVEKIAGPEAFTGEPPDIWITHDGNVFARGDGHLFQLAELTKTERVAPVEPLSLLHSSQIAITSDGTFVVCGAAVLVSSPTSAAFQTLGGIGCPGAPCCAALYAQSTTSIYAATNISTKPLLWWNGSTMVTQSISNVVSLGGAAGTVVAVDGAGVIYENVSGTWSALPALPASCTASVATVAPSGLVYVGGSCGPPVLWTYDASGSSWQEVYRDSSGAKFSAISIAGDGTVFVSSGQRVLIGAAGTWTAHDVGGEALAAISATDAWATDGAAQTRIMHWDGARWTPVAFSPAQLFDIAASASDVITYGSVSLGSPSPAWQSLLRLP